MQKRELIFDGNEKQVFATDDPHKVIFRYKDVTLAFDSIKRAVLRGKGVLDNKISAILLGYLNRNGISTHFVELFSEREQICRKIEIIPLEVVVRNRVAGSMARNLGIPEGTPLHNVVYELKYNNESLGDPLINEHHAVALGLASYDEVRRMLDVARRANEILKPLFARLDIELVDFKIEFGRASDNGEIIISDEISPDTSRLWDQRTREPLDKDRFRLDLGNVVAGYEEVYNRLLTLN